MPLIDAPHAPVHVVDRGSGEAVVFLHAFPLQAAQWDYQIEALESRFRCVAIDLPGFGQSPEPEAPESASMAGYADLVNEVLDELGIDSATFVGASMGGYVIMALLRRHPGKVAQVVLAGTRARSDDAATAARRTDQQEQLRSGAEVCTLAKGVVEGLMSSGSMGRPELVEYIHALAEPGTPAGWIAALEAMKRRDDALLVLRNAGKAGIRSLVIAGELDRVTPLTDALALRSSLKAELVTIAGAGHLPNVEDPAAFDAALLTFLGVSPEEQAAEAALAAEAAAELAEEGAAADDTASDEATSADADTTADGETVDIAAE